MNFLEETKKYWNTQAEAYSDYNDIELESGIYKLWEDFLKNALQNKKNLTILEVGCGPGLFAILLAKMGHTVTAVDYSEEMVKKAKENAKKHGLENKITHLTMDAHQLDFAEESFDVVVSRMMTWILDDTEKAYREWLRVLKPAGTIINMDANWYLHLNDEEAAKAYKQVMEEYENSPYFNGEETNKHDVPDEFNKALPMSKVRRPQWDIDKLIGMDVSEIRLVPKLKGDIFTPALNLLSKSTPVFMLVVEK